MGYSEDATIPLYPFIPLPLTRTMTTDELEQLLAQQPVNRLHRLAQGRVHRHFRLGKRRLIEALLQHSAENRAGLESDLALLMQDNAVPKVRPAAPHRRAELAPTPS